LEQSVNSTAGQDISKIRVQLDVTQTHILEHFRFEEQKGYMDKVRKREPRFERTIEQLAKEHRQLAQSLEDLISEVNKAGSLNLRCLESVKKWIAAVRKHEAREDELVQEAFNLDISAED